jgi:hypothetical protein
MITPKKNTLYTLSVMLLAGICLSACNKQDADVDIKSASTVKAQAPAPANANSANEKKLADKAMLDTLSTATQPASAAALNLGEFKIIDIRLGTRLDSDNAVENASTAFKPKDKVYASVLSTGKHPGLKIQARWTAPDGMLVAKTEQLIAPTGAMVTTFSVAHDQAWPAGAYALEVSLNEQVQKTTSFEIR